MRPIVEMDLDLPVGHEPTFSDRSVVVEHLDNKAGRGVSHPDEPDGGSLLRVTL